AAALLSPHWLLPNDQGRELDWPLWALPLGNSYLLLGAVFLACVLAAPRSFATPRTQTAPHPAAT
ncbi:mannosyltransferase, partial [Corynebacterium mastitidis]